MARNRSPARLAAVGLATLCLRTVGVVADSSAAIGNPNVLTRDAGCSPLSQGPSCNSCLVEVTRFAGNLPPVEAFDLPLAD